MAANASVVCPFFAQESVKIAITNLAYAAFFWIKPICLILDFFGHFLSFLAFYKQSRSSKIYSFQLYEAISKASDTFTTALKIITYNWLAGVSYNLGVEWYQKNYALMWFAAHLSIPFSDMTATMHLFFSLATSIDRAYAISQPMEYKLINRKIWETTALSISISISFLISFFVCFQYMVDKDENSRIYKVTGDLIFQASLIATICIHLRNTVWCLGVIALVVSSFRMMYLYQNRRKKVAAMTVGNVHVESHKDKERRSAEKVLSILTMYNVVQAINQISVLIVQTVLAFRSQSGVCDGNLVSAIRNIEIGLVNASDFYVMLLVSKQFRKLIRRSLPHRKTHVATSQVATNFLNPKKNNYNIFCHF